MGHWFAEIALSHPRKPELKPFRVNALADTGALMLCTSQSRQTVVINPNSPNIPHARIM
jgi:hypothetical protein